MAQAFRGEVAVVTGGSEGIGYSIAKALSREGARLVLGARRKAPLDAAAATLRTGGRECRAVPCDVTDPQQLAALMNAGLERWDRLDILIANAGVGLSGPFAELSREDLRQVFEVNVHGVLNSIQAALPTMLERGAGKIVLVSSVLGYRGVPGYSGYCATKAALNSLAESLHSELAPRGIHVMLAAPGLTETRFHEARLGPKSIADMRGKLKAQDPDDCGRQIVQALRRRKRRVVLTRDGRLLSFLARHLPNLTDRAIGRWHGKLDSTPAAPTPS